MTWRILEGDCLALMPSLADASVDAIVTDPPYGLGFMGREWDALPPGLAWAQECLRLLKPGGHLLAFGGTRTYHRLTCAIEDAGFEIRDCIAWMYGSGFPKSLDVSKAIDKAARGVPQGGSDPTSPNHGRFKSGCSEDNPSGRGFGAGPGQFMATPLDTVSERTARPSGAATADDSPPSTLDATASEWQGWGTALKPAHEPIVVARKPLDGTVAATVLRHGTGALNVAGCRVGWGEEGDKSAERKSKGYSDAAKKALGTVVAADRASGSGFSGEVVGTDASAGRWPANVVLDPEAAAMLDEQTGELHSQDPATRRSRSTVEGVTAMGTGASVEYADRGGASRFFYVAKAGSAERNNGARNTHPTVKPIALMQWLVRLVTPPGGIVLDPFAGSGTTGIACLREGFSFVGIERAAEYAAIARARIVGDCPLHNTGIEVVAWPATR